MCVCWVKDGRVISSANMDAINDSAAVWVCAMSSICVSLSTHSSLFPHSGTCKSIKDPHYWRRSNQLIVAQRRWTRKDKEASNGSQGQDTQLYLLFFSLIAGWRHFTWNLLIDQSLLIWLDCKECELLMKGCDWTRTLARTRKNTMPVLYFSNPRCEVKSTGCLWI